MTTKIQRSSLPMRAYFWLVLVAALAGCAAPPATTVPQTDASGWTKDEVVDSYIFGYPLVLMTMAHAAANDGHGAVDNTLRHAVPPGGPGMSAQRTPDVDTVHSTAWLDLAAEPVVLALPDAHGRYLNARVLDMWTNAVWSTAPLVDSRNARMKARTIAFVPRGWAGTLPPGIERVDAPAKRLWLSVRIGMNSARELEGARRLQRAIRLAPLAAWLADEQQARDTRGKQAKRTKQDAPAEARALDDDTPSAYACTPGAQVAAVAALDAKTFFSRLAAALPDNPPVPPDAHALGILADIGVKPGEPAHLPERAASAVAAGVAEARARIATPPVNALSANGWFWLGDDVGYYEDDYTLRAFAAATRTGIGTRNDELRPTTKVDSEGQALDGATRYLLHFEAKALPPARAFWSITAYTADGALAGTLAPRRSIVWRDGLPRNRDGSLDIWVSSANPGRANETNWLAAPSGPFELVMRLYSPQPQATDGSWQPPALVRR